MSRRGLARHNAKRDENEPEIRRRFAYHGWHTEQVSGKGMPDLLVWPEFAPGANLGRRAVLVDVKMPKGKLKPAQEKKWRELHEKGIPVYVVRTAADVDALVGGTLEPWRPMGMGHAIRTQDHVRVKGKLKPSANYTPPKGPGVGAAQEAEETFAPGPDAPDMTPALGPGPHPQHYDCPCAPCVGQWGAT